MTSVPSGAQAVVWRLAVDLEMGMIEPERVVRAASQLVEMGVDDDAVIALAVMPSDLRQLRVDDVEPLVRTLVANLRVALPTSEQAGWATAAFIAEAMIEGAVAPVVGASRIWRLWEQCDDQAGVLAWMLQLTEAWE
jgi:hypothetical protein